GRPGRQRRSAGRDPNGAAVELMGDEARLTWWGHATASIEIDGVHVLTDPLLRGRVGPLRWYAARPPAALADQADAVLISHLHRDHFDRRSLAAVPAETPIVVPRGARSLVPSAGRRNVIEMRADDTVHLSALTVRAVTAVHSPRRDSVRRQPRAEPLGYVVRGSCAVYFAGDTALFAGMRGIDPDLDLALLPVGGWGLTLGAGHLDPRAAVEAVALIGARRAVPIHWGTLRPPLLWRLRGGLFTTPGPRFVELAAELDGVDVVLATPGQPISISA
ncbi:MAG: MBL fold metallo-hydrolase, partial [Acidimicrobiaceae bacterium]|nr:MBL fold metallo-hydrolase [Acidimicrobiaceae bacterium]